MNTETTAYLTDLYRRFIAADADVYWSETRIEAFWFTPDAGEKIKPLLAEYSVFAKKHPFAHDFFHALLKQHEPEKMKALQRTADFYASRTKGRAA